MNFSFRQAWILLSLATVLSLFLDASIRGAWVGSVMILVAFFKARLVLMVFMEVSDSSPMVRRVCEAWTVLACTAVLATYWLAPRLV